MAQDTTAGLPQQTSAMAPPLPPTSQSLQVLNLPSTTQSERQAHASLLADLEARKRAPLIDVPTLSHDVRDALRNLNQPVRLFGENNANVRDRLRMVMARAEVARGGGTELETASSLAREEALMTEAKKGEDEEEKVTKYTHAQEELIKARDFMAEFSLRRAQRRLNLERRRRWGARKRARLYIGGNNDTSDPNSQDVFYEVGGDGDGSDDNVVQLVNDMDESCRTLYKSVRSIALEGSQYGDARPLSAICTSRCDSTDFNPNLIATGGWSGAIKLWNGNSSGLELLSTRSMAHEDRIMGIAMQPLLNANNTNNGNQNSINTMLATASIDLTAKLWNVRKNEDVHSDQEESTANKYENEGSLSPYTIEEVVHLKGHAARLCCVAFHPSGRYVGTTSFDHTWRLWDVESGGKELLLQDGHWKEVYGIGFHDDGSLVSTTDFGSIVQVWDLRTGKSACHFSGHAKRVLCSEFSPNGFQMASAGDDGTIKIWDLRQRKLYASIPAHSKLISQIKFAHKSKGSTNESSDNSSVQQNGEFLTSCSFDGTAKVWSTRDWKLLSTLSGHEGKIMGVDVLSETISSTGKSGPKMGIVTCGYDKTLKLWH